MIVLAAIDTVVLSIAVAAFQGRENRFFSRFEGAARWVVYFVVLLAVNLLALLPVVGILLALAVWWWAALALFGFTIRRRDSTPA